MKRNTELKLVPEVVDPISLAHGLAAELPTQEIDVDSVMQHRTFRKLVKSMGYDKLRQVHFAGMIARAGVDPLPHILTYIKRYPQCRKPT